MIVSSSMLLSLRFSLIYRAVSRSFLTANYEQSQHALVNNSDKLTPYDLSSVTQPMAYFFYSRTRTIFVRGTDENSEIVERFMF